jgi:hypothetical protein
MSGAHLAQATQLLGTRIAKTLAAALAPRASPSGMRCSTWVCGAVASALVVSKLGEANRDDYYLSGLNIDYEDLFVNARWSLSWLLHTWAHILQQAMIQVSFIKCNL